MKTLLKASGILILLLVATYGGLVVGYHCSKDFRWMIRDIIAEEEAKQEVAKYVAQGLSPQVIERLMAGRSVIGGAFRDVQKAYEPEYIPFQLPGNW